MIAGGGASISGDGRQVALTFTASLLDGGEDSGMSGYVYARPLTVRAGD